MEAILMMLLSLAIFGFVVYLIVTYIPMPQIFKTMIIAVAAIFLLLWFLRSSGVNLLR